MSTALNTPPRNDWIAKLIATPGRSHRIQVAENTLHYLEWGQPDRTTLVMVHGFLGHAHWWDFVAPWFANDYHIIAMDLGGMGDSGHRQSYARDLYVEEVAGVIRATSTGPVILIGHSFGGRLTVHTCRSYPQLVKHAIVIDAKLGFPDKPARPRLRPPPKQDYPDFETACARFRFVPEEPATIPQLAMHVAHHAVKEEHGRYGWKFDVNLIQGFERDALTEGEVLAQLELPIDFICGEHSEVVPPELAARIGSALRNGRGPIVIPAAYHHIPVNQPLELVAVLRALLAC